MDEPLRRHLALGHITAHAPEIGDAQAPPPNERGAHRLEMLWLHVTGGDVEYAHPLAQFVCGAIGAAERRFEPRARGFQMRAEDAAGAKIRDQMLQSEKRVDLARAEPKPGQRIT